MSNDTHEPTGARLTDKQIDSIEQFAVWNSHPQIGDAKLILASRYLAALLADRAQQDERIAALERELNQAVVEGDMARQERNHAEAKALAMRPLVEATIKGGWYEEVRLSDQTVWCRGCGVEIGGGFAHRHDCVVAQWQAPATPDDKSIPSHYHCGQRPCVCGSPDCEAQYATAPTPDGQEGGEG